ncbi:2-hydroxyacid dehydrogenase [Saccharophagus degradans]|uniref:D-isomer specific 2-hydroxyacid dehydrogenase, NAD-binding n=1 Tax=Saccharophagus degradans (strain 2-40 / ATCC 43961 / DSM 17024) TaxID=203122 RepID=Q21GQ6_SACD2|nr:2-hydroxyacid dehydrogenase [Saccharophagus degradans]ABD82123.1 D-isomer specific 2-hydroxyacid dehydrogenase, NAD-binding [Saccharophagus degradans 2-40]
MKIGLFSSKKYDKVVFHQINSGQHEITYHPVRLNKDTVKLASGFEAICCFVNDEIDASVIASLSNMNVKLLALRCAGFNNVDLPAAKANNLPICRVPEYSPHAVAEHTCALILDLNRNIHRAHNRIRENDYSLDGLLGFDLHGKTVGVIGAGKIGRAFIKIMLGFGCNIQVCDPDYAQPDNPKIKKGDLDDVLQNSNIISLHCPLVPSTHHMINQAAIDKMKPGVMLINTSRGGLVDTSAVIRALKNKKIGHLGLDVYEEESEMFFEDFSDTFIQDDVFARLQTFPNVTITGHQAFFTKEALEKIARTTLTNIEHFQRGEFDKVHFVST